MVAFALVDHCWSSTGEQCSWWATGIAGQPCGGLPLGLRCCPGVSGGQCHLIHLTIISCFSWAILTCMCTNIYSFIHGSPNIQRNVGDTYKSLNIPDSSTEHGVLFSRGTTCWMSAPIATKAHYFFIASRPTPRDILALA